MFNNKKRTEALENKFKRKIKELEYEKDAILDYIISDPEKYIRKNVKKFQRQNDSSRIGNNTKYFFEKAKIICDVSCNFYCDVKLIFSVYFNDINVPCNQEKAKELYYFVENYIKDYK